MTTGEPMTDPYVVQVRTAAGPVLIGPFDSRDKAVAWAGTTGMIVPLFSPSASAAMLIATASLHQAMNLLMPQKPAEPLVEMTDK